jgi:hypothetical protein
MKELQRELKNSSIFKMIAKQSKPMPLYKEKSRSIIL